MSRLYTIRSGKRSPLRRIGFTLLEVVFALALTVLLMGAIGGSLQLFRQLSSAGRDDVEQAQLVRAIFRKMEIDIRSSIDPNQNTGAAEGESETEGEEDSEEIVVTEIDASEAYSGQSLGVVGDSTSLVVHINRPSRDLAELLLPAAEQSYAPPGDLKSVAYFLAVVGGGGLQGAAGDLIASQDSTTASTSGVRGLCRLEGDRMAVDFADASADLQTLAANTNLLAEEVDSLEFRYFDGLEWYEAWDSVAYERLPNAVEITIGFRPPGEMNSAAVSAGTTVYRFVVAIPVAEPPVEGL